MGALFYLALNMSLTAAAIGLVVLLLRLVSGGRLPAKVRYALWGLVLLRLVLPFSFPSFLSFYNAVGRLFLPVVSVPAGALTTTNVIRAADAYFPLHFKSDLLARLFGAAGWVWLAPLPAWPHTAPAARASRASPTNTRTNLATNMVFLPCPSFKAL
jgi:hypothetical protein